MSRAFTEYTSVSVDDATVATVVWSDGIHEVSTISISGWEATHTITFAAEGKPPVVARKSAGRWSVFGPTGNLLFANKSFVDARELGHGEALWVAAEAS